MTWPDRWKRNLTRGLSRLPLGSIEPEAVLPLSVLGLVTGIVAGLAMVAFRFVIETPQHFFLGPDRIENYGYLEPLALILLPTAGGLATGLVFQRLAPADRSVGVVHVMQHLAYGDAQLPFKNAIIQFFSAVVCIVSGHSVGREGPAVHIGAACGSWLGQRLQLPNNSSRLLVGCGAAGAIAAAFNTPLAGVVFAMEVIMMEYSIANFIPIILAAVSAATLSQSVFGWTRVFDIPDAWPGSAMDLTYILMMGLVIGILSTALVRLIMLFNRLGSELRLWLRMTLAGVATGLIAVVAPEIMGSGYDTVAQTLAGHPGLELLLTVLACKILATALAIGLGIPGGIIGPTLMMGAISGGALGIIFAQYFPAHSTSPTFFTMLGMGAMMGATLNAPLAALTTLLELTGNPDIIMPGMLVVVTASLTSHQLFNTPSVFIKLMQAQGMGARIDDPIAQLLRRLSVARYMQRKVIELPQHLERPALEAKLVSSPAWLLVRHVQSRPSIVLAADVVRYLREHPDQHQTIDLDLIAATRLETAPISIKATLFNAMRKMEREGLDALYVIPPFGDDILGIITRRDIRRSYRYSST